MFKMRFRCGSLDMYYLVEQKTKNHFAVSQVDCGREVFITHRENSRQACKLAKLLAKTYYEAYCRGAY